MLEYLLIGAAIIVAIAIPSLRGNRRQRDAGTRSDSNYTGTDSSGSVWTFSDASSSSDAGSCSDSSGGDSSSGGDCGSSSSSD